MSATDLFFSHTSAANRGRPRSPPIPPPPYNLIRTQVFLLANVTTGHVLFLGVSSP